MSNVTVQLGARSYPIYIEAGLLTQPGFFSSFIKGPLAVIITNPTVAAHYLDDAIAACGDCRVEVIEVADGESYKSLASFDMIMTRLLEMNAARDTTLIALGGGVIGDLCGFVAATYQRGVPFIQVPTTLLSQVDSSVGGKTAVNHPLGKNMIGAFYQPQAVIIDTATLSTLPPREFSAGMAEVIKYGIIYDAPFFHWLAENADALLALTPSAVIATIRRCCEIKAEVVAIDEREGGLRAILNLGHTFGHAIEAEQGYGVWLHGEAVAAGMVLACKTAEQLQWLTTSETRQVCELIAAFSLPVEGPAAMGKDAYVKHMKHDKKVAEGRLHFVLPTKIGEAVVTDSVTDDILSSVLTTAR